MGLLAAATQRSAGALEISLVLPTYQERANIERAIRDATRALAGIEHEVVVVDDASPDGTAAIAESLADEGIPVRVVRRVGERGLSSAVVRGFREAKGEILIVMDADGSHPPELLPDLVNKVREGADIAVASRYAQGGGIEGWPWRRRTVSRVATRLASHLTHVRDPMSGYFAARREVVDGIAFAPRGFKIGLEVLVRGRHTNVVEVPFVFRDREHGKSKLKPRIYGEYIAHLWELTRIANPVAFQGLKYLIVGGLGVLVNLGVFTALDATFHVAGELALIASFCVAVLFNFVLNKAWTFRDRSRSPPVVARKLALFVAISLVGLGINLGVYALLTRQFTFVHLIAQASGLVLAAVWNFEASRRITFRSQRA